MAEQQERQKPNKAESDMIVDIICRKDIEEAKRNSDLIKGDIEEFAKKAIKIDDRKMLKLFISWGLFESCFDKTGKLDITTLLAESVSECRTECLKLLLESVFKLYGQQQAQDSANFVMQKMPFIPGSDINFKETFDILFSFGADINRVFNTYTTSGRWQDKTTTLFHSYLSNGCLKMAENMLAMPQFDLAGTVGLDGGYSIMSFLINCGYGSSCCPGSPLFEKILSVDTLNIKKTPEGEPNLISLAISYSYLGAYMLPMVKILMKAGVELGDTDDPGSAAFAAAKCDNAAVKKLVEDQIGRSCTPKLTASQERMFKSIRQNDLNGLINEINKGADVNIEKNPFTNRITPLMAAIITGASSQIVKTLLEAGADPNTRDVNGLSPIEMISIYPSKGPRIGVGSYYASLNTYNGVRMKSRYKPEAQTELGGAVNQMYINMKETTEFLISAGADVSKMDRNDIKVLIDNFKWNYGHTIDEELMTVSSDAIADTVYLLIRSGLNIDLNDLFKYALLKSVLPLAKRLLPPGLDINKKYKIEGGNRHTDYKSTEETIFIESILKKCNLSVLEYLLDIGADPTVTDSLGHDAEYYVRKVNYNYPDDIDNYLRLIERKQMEKTLETEDSRLVHATSFEFDI